MKNLPFKRSGLVSAVVGLGLSALSAVAQDATSLPRPHPRPQRSPPLPRLPPPANQRQHGSAELWCRFRCSNSRARR